MSYNLFWISHMEAMRKDSSKDGYICLIHSAHCDFKIIPGWYLLVVNWSKGWPRFKQNKTCVLLRRQFTELIGLFFFVKNFNNSKKIRWSLRNFSGNGISNSDFLLYPFQNFKSCHQRSSIKKLFLKISYIHRKTLVLVSLFNKVAGCEFCEIFKSTYFEKHLRTSASGNFLGKHREQKLLLLLWCFLSSMFSFFSFFQVLICYPALTYYKIPPPHKYF